MSNIKEKNKPGARETGNNSNGDAITVSKRKIIRGFLVGAAAMFGLSFTGGAVFGTKVTEARLQPYSVKNVVNDYADKLLARKNLLELAKRIFINEYNKFYGTNLNEDNVKMQIKHGNVNGFKLVHFEGFNAIQEAQNGSGSIIKFEILNEDGTVDRTLYGSRDEKGNPILTLDINKLAKVLNDEIQPDDFETKIIPEIYSMMANAITGSEAENEKEYTPKFEEDLINYLMELIKETQDEVIQDNFGEILEQPPIPTKAPDNEQETLRYNKNGELDPNGQYNENGDMIIPGLPTPYPKKEEEDIPYYDENLGYRTESELESASTDEILETMGDWEK